MVHSKTEKVQRVPTNSQDHTNTAFPMVTIPVRVVHLLQLMDIHSQVLMARGLGSYGVYILWVLTNG